MGLNFNDITCLVTGFEDNDFLSPGLSSIVLTKMGLSKFLPHFSIQGMACSTLPKLLELGKNLIHNENDKILFVISGCNSGWYLPHLKNNINGVTIYFSYPLVSYTSELWYMENKINHLFKNLKNTSYNTRLIYFYIL